MTEGPGKRELVREERRQQILQAALKVFSAKGFHAANVSDVAAEAGVSQGTIYWYFDSKHELFEAAFTSVIDGFVEEVFPKLDSLQTATEKLKALTQQMENYADVIEGLMILLLGYWASSAHREQSARAWTELLAEAVDATAAIIEEGIESGEFRPVDANAVAWALLAAYDGLAAYTMFIPGLELRRSSQALVDAVMGGLLADEQGITAEQM
jgi:AcrR family transcriptional regulator